MSKEEYYDADEIDLSKIFAGLRRNLIPLIITLLLCIIISFTYSYRKYSNSFSAVVGLDFSFKELETGKFPNGSKFSLEQLTSKPVIQEALKKMGEDYSGEMISEVGRSLMIVPLIPDQIEKQIQAAEKKGELFRYYPSQYQIRIQFFNNFTKDSQLLSYLIDEYITNVLNENFRPDVANYKAELSVLKADYDLSYEYFNNVSQGFMKFLKDTIDPPENTVNTVNTVLLSYRTPESISLQRIFSNLQILLSNSGNLTSIRGLIYHDGITKNKEIAYTRVTQKIQKLKLQESLERQKFTLMKNNIIDLLNTSVKSNSDKSRKNDSSGPMIVQNNEFLGKVITDVNKAGIEYLNLQSEITELNIQEKALKQQTPQKLKKAQTEIEKLFSALFQDYNQLVDDAQSFFNSFSENNVELYVSVVGDVKMHSDINLKKSMLISVLASLMITGFIALILLYRQREQ